MFDRFSIDFRCLEVYLSCIWDVSGVYLRCIWGVSGVYLGDQAAWRRSGGGMGGDLRCSYRNLWWPIAAECWVTARDFLIFVDFCQKCQKMTLFVSRCSNCLQITKNNFLRFWHFYPLVSSFQPLLRSSTRRTFHSLSFALKNSSFDFIWLEIYRFSIDFR